MAPWQVIRQNPRAPTPPTPVGSSDQCLVNGFFNPNISHWQVGYNPLDNLLLLLTSWNIQAGSKFPKHRDPLGHAIFTQRAHWRVFRRQIQRRAVGPSFPDGKGLAGCNGENTNKKHIECPLPSQNAIHFYQIYATPTEHKERYIFGFNWVHSALGF